MKLSSAFLLILLLLGRCSDEKMEEWKKFVPLKTTRTDVEALLGPAQGAYEVLYQLKDGRLSIEYSIGPCKPGQKGGWNVPENVVISLHFSPRRANSLRELNLDLTKFRRVVAAHTPSYTYYIDDINGVTYAIEGGKVAYIEYGPAKKFNDLYCKN